MSMLSPATELDAINRMLKSIGQAPVNSLSITGISDVSKAIQDLQETSRDTQVAGWSWNTDRNYLLSPDVNGYIVIPQGTLDVDPEDRTRSVVIRRNPVNGQMSLYDQDGQTFIFSSAVPSTIIWGFAFDDLPQTARTYISTAAARRFQARVVGSQILDAFHAADEQRAWVLLQRGERRTRDTNAFRANLQSGRALRRRF